MTRPSRFTNPGANTQNRVGGYPDQPAGNDPPVTWPPPITDPDDFPDRAEEQPAQIPVALGTPALAQPIQSTRVLVVDGNTGTITFDDPLTPGNIMVAGIAFRENIGATATLEGDGWNLIDDAYTGSEDGNWPGFLYWRTVQPGDGQSWDCTRSTGSGGFGFWIMELEGVATLDVPLASSNATTEPTGSLTPTDSVPVMLVSFASVRNDTDQTFTPAGSMSEQLDTFYGNGDDGPQVAVNTQSVTTPSGSYTVGSTYGGGSRRFLLAASFAGGTGFADGLNSVDGDDATYDETDTEEVIRVDLGDEYAIGRIRWYVGFDTAGAKSYDLMAANEPDFSDEVIATTLAPTGTGSYTAQEVADTWTPAGSYRFWRLVGAAESRRTFSFELYEIPDAGGVTVHDDLTGRDAADQHPADAVSFDPTGLSIITATDVQGGMEELDAAVSGGGIPATIFDAKGDLIVASAADTAARLAAGTNGYLLSSNSGATNGLEWIAPSAIPTGTSFPGSPSTGDIFHRTDLSPGLWRYDGTRWLCLCAHDMQLRTWSNITASDTFTFPNVYPFARVFDIWMVTYNVTIYQTSGTSSTNYVTATLRKWEAGVQSDLANCSSQNNTLAEFVVETASIGSALGTTADALSVHLTETGTVGIVYGAASLIYRLIAT
jgi:hypothetical protein